MGSSSLLWKSATEHKLNMKQDGDKIGTRIRNVQKIVMDNSTSVSTANFKFLLC